MGGRPGFTLASQAGLRLWLAADAITGKSDTQTVTTWADASGEGTDETQTTEAKRLTYHTNIFGTLPSVRLDGTDDIHSNNTVNWRAADNKGTLYMIYKPSSVTGYRVLLATSDTGGAENGMEFATSGDKLRLTYRDGATTNGVDGQTVLVVGTTYLFTWTTTGSAYVLRINGFDEALTVAGVNDGAWLDTLATERDVVAIGGLLRSTECCYGAGDVGEIGYYDTQKGAADDTEITDHLMGKYGI